MTPGPPVPRDGARTFVAGLAVTYTVAAALEAATPPQRAVLRMTFGADAEANPLRDPALSGREAFAETVRLVREIMGPEWEPSRRWSEAIRKLIG